MPTTLSPRAPRPSATRVTSAPTGAVIGAPGTPVALGALQLVPSLRDPRLLLIIRCPRCAKEHVHSWATDVPAREPQARTPHCATATMDSPPYYVAPADTPANAATLREYARRCEAGGRAKSMGCAD